jgi:hypothetical protein
MMTALKGRKYDGENTKKYHVSIVVSFSRLLTMIVFSCYRCFELCVCVRAFVRACVCVAMAITGHREIVIIFLQEDDYML